MPTGTLKNFTLKAKLLDPTYSVIDVPNRRAPAVWSLTNVSGWGDKIGNTCNGQSGVRSIDPGETFKITCRVVTSGLLGVAPPPPEDEICEEEAAFCFANGGTWKGCNTGCFSPIVVDVAGNKFDLTDAENGVDFDLTGDGVKDRVSWTAVDSDDAWLVLDRNRNGTIDNGLELFGNYTEQPPAIPRRDRNGFHALAVFDDPTNGGNGDGNIDNQDAVFADLRLWQDKNHNGISEAGELHTLPNLGIGSFELDFKESKKTDEYGNRFTYRAKVWDAQKQKTGRWAWDVFPVRPKPWN